MKKIGIMLLLSVSLFTAANAQKYGGGIRGGGNFYRGGSRVIVTTRPYFPMYYGMGFGMGSPYFGYGYGWGYPGPYYNGYNYTPKPSRLDMQIEDIKHEYQQKINAARDDNSISGKERRSAVRQLKQERELAITDAKRDFYKNRDK